MKKIISAALAGLFVFTGSAYAQDTQATFILSQDKDGGQYALVSVKHDVTPAFGIRADIYKSTWDTNYNDTSGTGTAIGARYAAYMGFDLSENATATITLGASNYDRSVSPVTTASPSSYDKFGVYSVAEVYVGAESGELNGLLEYDGASKVTYGSANYLFNLGKFKVGPAANIVKQDNYQRNAIGIKSALQITEKVKLELSAYKAKQKIDSQDEINVDFIELGLVTKF